MLAGEPLGDRQVGLRTCDVPALETADEAVNESVRSPLGVADPSGHLEEFAVDGKDLVDRVRGKKRSSAAVERVCERAVVPGVAGELDGLATHSVAPVTKRLSRR